MFFKDGRAWRHTGKNEKNETVKVRDRERVKEEMGEVRENPLWMFCKPYVVHITHCCVPKWFITPNISPETVRTRRQSPHTLSRHHLWELHSLKHSQRDRGTSNDDSIQSAIHSSVFVPFFHNVAILKLHVKCFYMIFSLMARGCMNTGPCAY